MHKILIFLLFPTLVFGALNSSKSVTSELEILALPFENQKQVFQANDRTYKNLVAIAKDSKIGFNKRWKAVTALSEIFRDKAFDDLYTLSFSKEWFIKNAVVVGISNLKSPEKVEILGRLLKDSSLVVRSAVVEEIKVQKIENLRDELWEELNLPRNFKNNQSLWIRKQIIKLLSVNPKNHERKLFHRLLHE
ncbi:MAG: HEAT repeat domain-containing protein, partial [Bdellovibrionaceae bacterium]|nr:HEAT repeat domain-containing protein [Pseudobdellovibrionaceae bacterium]